MIATPELIRNEKLPKLFYTVEQAAAVLNVSVKTVRRWLYRGHLTNCNASRKILIPCHQVENFVKETCAKPTALN
jgi:excisionase family DNA binding protein